MKNLCRVIIVITEVVLCLQAAAEEVSPPTTEFQYVTIDVPGSISTVLRDINNRGEIIGDCEMQELAPSRGFNYANGRFGSPNLPPTLDCTMNGINDRGFVVGSFTTSEQHAFVLEPRTLGRGKAVFSTMDAPFPTGVFATIANDINNRGEIVGEYFDSLQPDHQQHGFICSGEGYSSIDVPGATSTSACGINDDGEIVGFCSGLSDGRIHGFKLSRGEYLQIDVPFSGAYDTIATAINNQGQIVGIYSDESGTHGYVYRQGHFISIDVAGAITTMALGINNYGTVVGCFTDKSFRVHGFLATPLEKRDRLLTSKPTISLPQFEQKTL